MYDLTFNTTGEWQGLSYITVNNTVHSNDIISGSLTLSFASGTSISWSATAQSANYTLTPSSGSLTISSDTTITIYSEYTGGGGEGGKD